LGRLVYRIWRSLSGCSNGFRVILGVGSKRITGSWWTPMVKILQLLHIHNKILDKKKKNAQEEVNRERESWDLGVGGEAVGGMVKRKGGSHWRGEKSHCIWFSSLCFVISQVEFRRKETLSTSLVYGRC
jgi:hypothetical protein